MPIRDKTQRSESRVPAAGTTDCPTDIPQPQGAKAILEESYLTRRQLAERWSCCGRTIARMERLTPVRFGRRLVRYRLSDVEKIEEEAA
jgi:hypothetical protein